MKNKITHILKKRPSLRVRRKKSGDNTEQAINGIPRITNETVAEHREEVLSSARKYIYPLQHSAHRVVIISITLITVGVVAFFAYCLLALYKFQSSSTFIYRITQVIPFPIAKAGPRFVAYENYLFELRHYIHYYQTQQHVDFNSDSGKQQLIEFRKRAMQIVVDYAYVDELAKKNHISVSDGELNDAIRLVRNQNRLGSNDQVFADVLKEFWGWSVSDFKRELKQQMLAQKVVSTLDTDAHKRAQNVDTLINQGQDFAALAKQYSDDTTTRDAGGDYGYVITPSDRNLPPQVIDELFKLNAGQVSPIINTGNTLEIIKVTQKDGDQVHASHISFAFKSIDTYIGPTRNKNKPEIFISQ